MTRLVRLILSKNKITKLDQNSLAGGRNKTDDVKLNYLSYIVFRCFQPGGTGAVKQLPRVHPYRGPGLTGQPQVSQLGLK